MWIHEGAFEILTSVIEVDVLSLFIDHYKLLSEASLVIEQANNRTFAAQVVLKKILEHTSG